MAPNSELMSLEIKRRTFPETQDTIPASPALEESSLAIAAARIAAPASAFSFSVTESDAGPCAKAANGKNRKLKAIIAIKTKLMYFFFPREMSHRDIFFFKNFSIKY